MEKKNSTDCYFNYEIFFKILITVNGKGLTVISHYEQTGFYYIQRDSWKHDNLGKKDGY